MHICFIVRGQGKHGSCVESFKTSRRGCGLELAATFEAFELSELFDNCRWPHWAQPSEHQATNHSAVGSYILLARMVTMDRSRFGYPLNLSC